MVRVSSQGCSTEINGLNKDLMLFTGAIFFICTGSHPSEPLVRPFALLQDQGKKAGDPDRGKNDQSNHHKIF